MSSPDVPLTLRALRRLALCALIPLAACVGDSNAEAGATPDDIDTESDPTVTEEELAAFTPHADELLTEEQITNYLQTSLLQFDLIRKQSAGLHETAEKIEERGEDGGLVAGLRNLADAGRLVVGAADLIGGSYVRSARTLGHNPAEMEWVRDRMIETASYITGLQLQEMSRSAIEQVREQANDLKRRREGGEDVYISAADIEQMFAQADEMEREFEAGQDQTGRANAELLRRVRPAVTEAMWMQLGWHGGGPFAWAGLSNPQDTTAQRQLDEYRRVFEDALANRVSPGLEAESGR